MKQGAVSRLCDLTVLPMSCSSLLSAMVLCRLEGNVSIRRRKMGVQGET